MFPHLSTTARAVTFYLMALAMCCAFAIFWPNGEFAAVLAMTTPALSVLIMQLVVTRDGWRRGGWAKLGLNRLGLRVWGLAVALPFGIVLVSDAVVRLTGLTTWQPLTSTELGWVFGDLPFLLIFVLFEELGWRGYLSPLLATDGRRAPYLRTGLLHGIWHLPLVYLATDSYLTEGNKWIIVPIFLAVLAAAGQVYGKLREVSGSVYPAVLLHAGFNMALGIAVYGTATTDPDAVAALGREAGIVTLVLVVVAALWATTWRTAARTPLAVVPSPLPAEAATVNGRN